MICGEQRWQSAISSRYLKIHWKYFIAELVIGYHFHHPHPEA